MLSLRLSLRASKLLLPSRRTAARALSSSSASADVLGSSSFPWIDPATGVYHRWSDNAFVASGSSSADDDTFLQVTNPATQDVIGRIPESMSQADFATVLQKSQAAFQSWSRVPLPQRQRVMLRLQQLLRDHLDDLSKIITLENGKTLADARGDVVRGLEVVESCANIAPHLQGESLLGLSSDGGLDTVSYRQPLGVCAGVCPFNFPAMIPLWMFPLAVTCGNSFVLKPSERTPGASLLLAQLAAEAGLPPNVLQVVHGGVGTVQQLCQAAPEVKAISFVGSNAAGEAIYEKGTAHGARVQANLGAKNHAVILPDVADQNAVVQAVAGAAFGAAGQRCMALSVVIAVGDDTKDWLVPGILEAAKALRVGPGWHDGVDVGPLISAAAQERVLGILAQAEEQGAEILLDGRKNLEVPAGYEKGNFVGPTVVRVKSTDNAAYTQEIFGPVLTVLEAPDPGSGHGHHQRQSLRQRLRLVYCVRGGGAPLYGPDRVRSGRHQRAHSRAAAHVFLHGQQAQHSRRLEFLRQVGSALLHAVEDGHHQLAVSAAVEQSGWGDHAHHEVNKAST